MYGSYQNYCSTYLAHRNLFNEFQTLGVETLDREPHGHSGLVSYCLWSHPRLEDSG